MIRKFENFSMILKPELDYEELIFISHEFDEYLSLKMIIFGQLDGNNYNKLIMTKENFSSFIKKDGFIILWFECSSNERFNGVKDELSTFSSRLEDYGWIVNQYRLYIRSYKIVICKENNIKVNLFLSKFNVV